MVRGKLVLQKTRYLLQVLSAENCSSQFVEHRSYPGLRRHDLVGEEEELEPVVLEDVLEELDDLKREHVLPTVVAHLEDGRLVDGLLLQQLDQLLVLLLLVVAEQDAQLFDLVDAQRNDLNVPEWLSYYNPGFTDVTKRVR